MTARTVEPLAGIQILDLTQALSGPFATMILADLGATVIKVEPPRGDLTRNTPPHFIGDTSLYFIANNRGKRSVVLDLKNAAQRSAFLDLVGQADVVISNFAAGVLERLGIDHATLAAVNPRIITCSITGYGRRGPKAGERAVDLVIQAAAAAMSITGHPGGEPARAGVPTADLGSGLFATIGVLAALEERHRTGVGRHVETSLFHSQLNLLNYVAAYSDYTRTAPPPMGSGHLGTVPSQAFETADGWIIIDAGFDAHFRSLCAAIGREEVASEERFATRPARATNRTELLSVIKPAIQARTSEFWLTELAARGIPVAPLNDVLAAIDDPQAVEYQSMQAVEYQDRFVRALSTPIWLDGHELPAGRRAPALGEHTRQVLGERLGLSEAFLDQLLQSDAAAMPSHVSDNRGPEQG